MALIKPASLLVVVKEAPELIKPTESTPSHVLSIIPSTDVFAGGLGSVLSSHLLLFQAPASPTQQHQFAKHNSSDIFSVLKSSLRQLLVPYYPLAGRLQPSSSHGFLQLVCNAHGALMIHAISNITLAQLKHLDKTYWSELQFDFVPDGSSDIPPLLVQVTMLACGGIALSIRLLHSLCDASGILHFLRGWSELARGDDQISILPIWDPKDLPASPTYGPSPRRFHLPSLGLPHKDHQISVDRHDFRQDQFGTRMSIPSTDIVAPYDHRRKLYSVDHEELVREFRDLVPITRLSISSDEIASLARLVRKQSMTRSCNTFEALAAHLWRERTRALGISGNTETRLFFPAPVYGDVPVIFYGQYPFNCQAIATAYELLSGDLATTVRIIQNAKTSVEPEFSTCVSDFAEMHAGPFGCVPNPAIFMFTLLSEDLSDIDFGFGTPPTTTDAVRIPAPVNVATIVGTSTDSLDILMTNVPAHLVDNLKSYVEANIPSGSKL